MTAKRGQNQNLVRLRDVAAAAGVNPSIASRVLNDDPTLSARPETRRRVRQAARQLGYAPNAFARGLKLQRTTTLGLVLPNVANAASQELVAGAERRAAASGYVVLLADAEDFARGGDVHRRLLLERRVDGLVIASTPTDARLIEELTQHHVPYVLVNRREAAGALCVAADDGAGITLAVGHLAGLGHRRIAYVAGAGGDDAADRRLAGFRAAIAELPDVAAEVVEDGPPTEAGGFAGAAGLLERTPPPTAVIAAGVPQATGAMAAVRQRGLVVPRDVSVIALHDAPLAAYLDPPLTTVSLPLREVAETAVAKLIAVIGGETAESVVVSTPPEIVVRGSTAPPGDVR